MLKDPRISLLLPWWREILLERFVPVVVLRRPAEVAWSLKMRDGFPIELGMALWAAYHRHLAAGLDGIEWIGVDYERLCEHPRETFGSLLRSLGSLGIDGAVDARAGMRAIRPELRRMTQPSALGHQEELAALDAIRQQWVPEPVSIRTASVSGVAGPTDWERAILAVHRETREAKAREDGVRLELSRLDSRLATVTSEHAALGTTAADLKAQADTMRLQRDAVASERDQARVALGDLESRFAVLSDEHLELDRGVAALVARLEDVVRERDSARSSVTRLEWHLDQERAQAALQRQETALTGRERDDAQARAARLEAEARALRDQLAGAVRQRDHVADQEGQGPRDRDGARLTTSGAAAATAPAASGRPEGSPTVRSMLRSARGQYRRALVRLPQAFVGLVWHNPLFDAPWYLERYPDVRATGFGPESHYRRHGAREGRDPNPFFDTGWYLERNPDVAQGRLNPLDHYLLFGAAEGRDPSRRFDTAWYLSTNPDVAESGADPLMHFLRHGMGEGRQPLPAGSLDAWKPAALPRRSAPANGSASIPLSIDAVRRTPVQPPNIADDVRVIALYESTYYPGDDPDAARSAWLDVVTARPLVPGQHQPHVPGDLGFYDQRLAETRHDQAQLARSYGIHGFCYAETWGRPDLHTLPFRQMIRSGEPDLPFTLRLTVGAASPVSALTTDWLKANLTQLATALEALLDRRAVTVGGQPVLLVEGLDVDAGPGVTDLIRAEAARLGLPGLFVVAPVASGMGVTSPDRLGVDALLAAHPDPRFIDGRGGRPRRSRSRPPTIARYDEYARRAQSDDARAGWLPMVLCGWDETPLGDQATIVLSDATPEAYGEWLRSAVSSARDGHPRDRRFVFVASWNDWIRGAHLEPDTQDGHFYLEHTASNLVPPLWAEGELA
jgi:hypothetical protein